MSLAVAMRFNIFLGVCRALGSRFRASAYRESEPKRLRAQSLSDFVQRACRDGARACRGIAARSVGFACETLESNACKLQRCCDFKSAFQQFSNHRRFKSAISNLLPLMTSLVGGAGFAEARCWSQACKRAGHAHAACCAGRGARAFRAARASA